MVSHGWPGFLGVQYDIQRDFKSSIQYCDAKIGPFMGIEQGCLSIHNCSKLVTLHTDSINKRQFHL